jgi:hypothetical protein
MRPVNPGRRSATGGRFLHGIQWSRVESHAHVVLPAEVALVVCDTMYMAVSIGEFCGALRFGDRAEHPLIDSLSGLV